MPEYRFILFPLVTLLAFFVKGATGFGTALIMVPIGSLLIGVHETIVVSSILDTIGGGILFGHNPLPDHRRYWGPMAAAMVAGSIAGAVILTFMPVDGFRVFLGIVVIVLGVWFMMGRGGKDESLLPHTPPETSSKSDIGVSLFSGLCGGLFGISGPPMVYYLGNRLAKSAFRSTLVAVFLFGGIARMGTYTAAGMVGGHTLILAAASVPGVLCGLWLGHHLFVRIPEVWFCRLVGVVLILSAVKLIW